MKPWTEQLVKKRACWEAVEWAQQYPTAQDAWQACDRGSWMLWLCQNFPAPFNSNRVYVQTTLAIAESVAHFCVEIPEAKAARIAVQAWLDNPCAATQQAAGAAGAAAGDAWETTRKVCGAAGLVARGTETAAGVAAGDAQNKAVADICRWYLTCPI